MNKTQFYFPFAYLLMAGGLFLSFRGRDTDDPSLKIPDLEWADEKDSHQIKNHSPRIQIALLLDSSGSMEGLLDQAKAQLWKMVNELATTKQNGQSPEIEIGLFQHGRDAISDGGYMTKHSDLTTDLDRVSELLFAFNIEGSEEYGPLAIYRSVDELKWSDSPDDLKIIIIAGNELFQQGPVEATAACKKAIKKGIIINTIFCGDNAEGRKMGWKEVAECAYGQFLVIDQNEKITYISSPYDDKIDSLNTLLNKTYIGYGSLGDEKMMNQSAQDINASSYGKANAANRAKTKATATYKNAEWDMVDAIKEDAQFLDKLKEEELPEEMKKMNAEERKNYLTMMESQRSALQAQILQTDKLRESWLAAQIKDMSSASTLDKVMLDALTKQAAEKKFIKD